MTKTQEKPSVPAGYKSLAGNLPPFVILDIGESLHGQVFRHRETTKTEKVRVKGKTEEVVKVKHYLDLTLIDGGSYNIGTVKKPAMRVFEKGEAVTLNLSSGIFNPLAREMFAEMGKPSDYWPEADEDFPALDWAAITGRNLYVRRENDGTVKKGQYAGNKRNVFTVAISPRA